MLMKEANLPVAFKVVNILTGEHKKEPYITINPAGTIPAFVDGDFKLAEGAAILVYLCETHGLSQWYPTDPQARAKVNQWLHWHHTGTRKSTRHILGPSLHDASEIDTTQLATSLPVLESTLANSKFVASQDHPTIADLFLLPELDQLGGDFHMGECLFDWSPYPNVERYIMDLIHALPSYAQNKAVAVAIMNMATASKLKT